MDRNPAEFRGVPMKFYANAADVTVSRGSNADAMAAKVAGYSPVSVVTAMGAHLNAAQYNPSDLLAFFESQR
ncbi:hypothetical protein AB0O54_09355 [Pseudarthrobacter oxydans]|uniref:hypothetical protein n=1 Tax=Pseudarthrobacter oxydans TaxID=1671 RepID=UPI0034163277